MSTTAELFQQGLQCHQTGRIGEAETYYRHVLQSEPRHSDAIHLLGVIAHQVGKNDIAQQLITQAIQINPQIASYHLNLGIVHHALNRPQEAITELTTAITLQPEDAKAYFNLGNIHITQKNTNEAITAYQKAIALNPAYAEALYNLGVAYQLGGQHEEAVISYQQALELSPNHVEARAVVAADFIPVGATLYDFGCGAMHLERYLPRGARYIPCDLVKRDERTLLCDFNQGTFPTVEQADCLTVLGVLEYIYDVAAFLKQLRTYNCSVVMSYNPAELTGHLDRPALGWVNHLSYEELVKACSDAGFSVFAKQAIEPNQLIFKLVPKDMPPILCQKILVLSYNNIGNFGDRLGFHLLQDILPPHAQVTHAHYKPWDMPAEPYDLLILGTGHSIYDETISDNLLKLVEQTPKVIGIFGTQYRHDIHPTRLNALLDRLTVWFARYEEDILLYGKNRDNVHHLGDWLMHYFPLPVSGDPSHAGAVKSRH